MQSRKLHILPYTIFLTILISVSGCSKDETVVEEKKYDESIIEQAYQKIQVIPGIRSLVVSHESEIIREGYYNNTTSGPDSIIDVRSVTKSIMSTLIGIAIDKGYIDNVDQTLSEYIDTLVPNLDEQKGNITIHQLLTMTTGLEWFEIAEPSEFGDFIYATNQLSYAIEKPIINEPGLVFDYSDGVAHLTSVVLTQATGMTTNEFAHRFLFEPLGIDTRFWYEDNQGYFYGGAGLCIGPHDMVKIGNLFLQKGKYDGKQILSEDWIEKSTTNYITTNNVVPYLTNYGYYWWIGNVKNFDFYTAMGYGGQFIFVIPDLELVIVTTCNFTGIGGSQQASQNWNSIIDIIVNYVVDAFIID